MSPEPSAASSPLPAYLASENTLKNVQNVGLIPRDIANRDGQYISAFTLDSRISILAIGADPIGWRKPYHKDIALGGEPGDGETEQ